MTSLFVKAGALLRVDFDAAAPNYGYLEACMRLLADGASEPLFLSSGAEDYFLSASYFDEGIFKTPNSGLTFFDKSGSVGVYKTHDRDNVVWRDGMALVFRRCEDTSGCGDMMHCPNQFCSPAEKQAQQTAQTASVGVSAQLEQDLLSRQKWLPAQQPGN